MTILGVKAKWSWLLSVCLALSVILGTLPATQAQEAPSADPALYAFPSEAAPGADLYAKGYGLTGGIEYELVVHDPPAPGRTSLGFFQTNRVGEFEVARTLPALPPGSHVLSVAELIDGAILASTPLTLLPALALALDPVTGPPGTQVGFTAANLVTGTLRLDYAGRPVLGPVAVGAGDYSGSFTVPGDRPEPLGSPAMVVAENQVASRTVGRAEALFESQEGPDPATYSFREIVLPTEPLSAGQVFTVTGQISPPPTGPLSQYTLKALWKTASGKVFPIGSGAPQFLSDGSFSVPAHVPSLLNGDPQGAEEGGQVGQVGVVLFANDNSPQTLSGWTPFGPLNPPPPFRVRVVDTMGNPIPNAVVDIRAFYTEIKEASGQQPSGGQTVFTTDDLALGGNQVQVAIGTLFPGQSDPFACKPTPVYGRTDGDGYFEAHFDPELMALLGSKIFLGYMPGPVYLQVPSEITFPVYVNALHQGYGQVVDGTPEAYTKQVKFSSNTNKFYDADLNPPPVLNTNPLVVTLPPLPAGTQLEMPIQPTVPGAVVKGGFDDYVGTGIPMVAYGNFLSFADQALYPDYLFTFRSDISIEFLHDALVYGSLTQVRLFLDGAEYEVLPIGGSPIEQCDGATTYRVKIPNSHRLTAGFHLARLEAKDASGYSTQRYIQLNVVNPPSWFKDPTYKNRTVSYTPSLVTIQGEQLSTGDPNSTTTLGANVPKVGQLDNAAGASGRLVQNFKAAGDVSTSFQRSIRSQALNTNAPNQTDIESAAGNNPITFGDSLTILDTGRMPLFRYVWGVWPIASATVGADMWFNATLYYNGQVTLNPVTGGTDTKLTVDPEATVGLDAFLDVSALFGFVKADAHALPEVGVGLPVEFTNGTKSDSAICFRYKLDIKWRAQVGPCVDTPFGSTCIKESGTENIFDHWQPDDKPLCTPQGGALATGSTETAAGVAATNPEPPPSASPAIAVDGFGHSLAVWNSEQGDILASTYLGTKWSTPVAVDGGRASIAPKVAFFGPNQAVAVWAKSGLAAGQASTATFTETVQAQHLAYAIWNGVAWSPPQNLTTLASNGEGEGDVALAGCLSTDASCPPGGAVTAVWMRDIVGNLAQRQFRLFHATYNGGVWSSPQPVDGASTGTDGEPEVVYQGGIPVVAWVRDLDRSLATVGDRMLAYRALNAPGVLIPEDLPAAITEPSLAVDPQGRLKLAFTVGVDPQAFAGNQRQLYAATQSCTPDCTWEVQPLVDSHGRPIHAEGPALTTDAAGAGTITYRALGFGPVPSGGYQTFAEDSLGVITGMGDLAQVKVDFLGTAVSPQYLTNDLATTWQASAVYDPLVKQTYAVAVNGSEPLLPGRVSVALASTATSAGSVPLAASQPLIFAPVAEQPDYVVAKIVPETLYPQTGELFITHVLVRNEGASSVAPAVDTPSLVATWDGPPGVGLPAGEDQVGGLSAGQAFTVPLEVAAPPNPNLPHHLFVTINANQAITETNLANNSLGIALGGLPAPGEVEISAQAGSSLLFLQWAPAADARVAGYRVYRGPAGGSLEPIGSSFGPSFVDVTAALEGSYEYRVASFAEDGSESAYSQPVEATLSPAQRYLVHLPIVRRQIGR